MPFLSVLGEERWGVRWWCFSYAVSELVVKISQDRTGEIVFEAVKNTLIWEMDKEN